MGEIQGRVCSICGADLEPVTGAGRPSRYCSTACRRSAELAIRRANERLADLEARAAHIRLHGRASCYAKLRGPEAMLAEIAAEIERQGARLREVLDT